MGGDKSSRLRGGLPSLKGQKVPVGFIKALIRRCMASTSCRSLVTTLGGVAAGVTEEELIEKIFDNGKIPLMTIIK